MKDVVKIVLEDSKGTIFVHYEFLQPKTNQSDAVPQEEIKGFNGGNHSDPESSSRDVQQAYSHRSSEDDPPKSKSSNEVDKAASGKKGTNNRAGKRKSSSEDEHKNEDTNPPRSKGTTSVDESTNQPRQKVQVPSSSNQREVQPSPEFMNWAYETIKQMQDKIKSMEEKMQEQEENISILQSTVEILKEEKKELAQKDISLEPQEDESPIMTPEFSQEEPAEELPSEEKKQQQVKRLNLCKTTKLLSIVCSKYRKKESK